MKTRFIRAFAFATAFATLSACAQVPPPSATIGQWDFAYNINGVKKVLPIQVFDDSKSKTYFQFHDGQAIPSIINAAGQILLPQKEGPYWVVNGVDRSYTLAVGMARGTVTHTSVESGVVKPEEVAESVAQSASVPASAVASSLSASAVTVGRASYRVPSPESRGDWTKNTYSSPLRGDATVFDFSDPQPAVKKRPARHRAKSQARAASVTSGTPNVASESLSTNVAKTGCDCITKK